MFCEKCGAQIDENDIFCTKCGHKQIETAPENKEVIIKPVKQYSEYNNYVVTKREVCGWKIAVGVVIEIVSLLFTFVFYAVKEDHLYSYDSWQAYNDMSSNNVDTFALIGIVVGIVSIVWGIIGEQKESYRKGGSMSSSYGGAGDDNWKCPQCGKINAGYRSCSCGYTR